MNTKKLCILLQLVVACLSLGGCTRSSDDVWEDTRSAGRHVGRGFKTLGGKHGDSRQVRCPEDFDACGDATYYGADVKADEYVPLEDAYSPDEIAMADSYSRPARETPGDPGSSIPGIEAFRDPQTIPGLSGVFKNIYFDYNSNLVNGQDNLAVVQKIAGYLKTHPKTYVFIEGHTDERGPEAYNIALGSRRSNAVRSLLIAEGVSPDNLFTISYGKERPVIDDHHEGAWTQNRRAEFKVYQR